MMRQEILHQLILIIKRKSMKKNQIKNSKNQSKKSFELSYSEASMQYVFEIFDEALFPLIIKYRSSRPRKLIVTQKQKLHFD